MAAVMTSTVTAETTANRYNLYAPIHKAYRAFMVDTLLQWGRMDATDDSERAQAVGSVRALLRTCANHLRHENVFVHPALERARAGSAAGTTHDHVEHEAAIETLRTALTQFESARPELRPSLGQQLYLELSAFVAENFEHMIIEETENHAVLVGAYSDEEMLDIEHRIVASMTPEEMFSDLRWAIPHINAQERAVLIGDIKRNAPREVFEAVLGLAREVLSQRDFYKLERALA